MQVNEVVVNGVKELSLVDDTVSEDTLLEGETAHDASGKQITGKVVVTPVDSELDAESENAVQNKAVIAGISNAVNDAKAYANEIISNPNLLDNPDFSINQRGQAEYLSIGHTVDRWKLGLSGNGNTGAYNSSAKTLICNTVETNGYFAYLRQFFENPSKLAGKEVTFSAALKETDSKWLIQVWTYSGETTTAIAATSYGDELLKTLTFTIPEDITDDDTLQFIIQTRGTSVLDWTKLELGSVATVFAPPNPATELAKCQRYLLQLAQSSAYRAVAIGTDYIDFSIPTPTTMRPISGMSIINPENFVVRSINPTVDQTGFSFSVVTYGTNQLRLRALKTAHGLTDATLAVKSSSTVFLSVEL